MADDVEPPRRGRPPRLSIEERRAAILDSACELFARGGRETTTVAAVAQRAGLQKPSVYRLYPSKDDLYRATVEREVERFTTLLVELYGATSGQPLADRIRARATGVVQHVAAEPSGMALLTRALRTWPDDALDEGLGLRARVLDVLARFAHDEAERDGVSLGPAAVAMAAVTFGLTQAVVELAVDDDRWSVHQLAELLSETAVAALTRSDPAIWVALGATSTGA